jgi:hypothetical protein
MEDFGTIKNKKRPDRSRGKLPNYSLLRVKKSKIVNRMREAITIMPTILISSHIASEA